MKNLKSIKKITIGHIFKYLISIFGEKRKCLTLKSNVDMKYFRTTMSGSVSVSRRLRPVRPLPPPRFSPSPGGVTTFPFTTLLLIKLKMTLEYPKAVRGQPHSQVLVRTCTESKHTSCEQIYKNLQIRYI